MTSTSEFEWRGHGLRGRPRALREVLGAREGDLLHRLRPDRVEPARRVAAADHGAGAAAALRAHARSRSSAAAPGMIGDPSGKTQERQLLSRRADRATTWTGIRAQLEQFLDFDARANPARIVNNADWLCQLDLIDFLRDIGKHFSVNYMLAQGVGERAARAARTASRSPSSPTCCCRPTTSCMLYDRYGCTLQTGRQRPVGQHHRGVRPDPAAARRRGARPGACRW